MILYVYMQDKCTPVIVAAQNGHVGVLSVLCNAGADLNAANNVVSVEYVNFLFVLQ